MVWEFRFERGGGRGRGMSDRAGAADGAGDGWSDGGGADVPDVVFGHYYVRDAFV